MVRRAVVGAVAGEDLRGPVVRSGLGGGLVVVVVVLLVVDVVSFS